MVSAAETAGYIFIGIKTRDSRRLPDQTGMGAMTQNSARNWAESVSGAIDKSCK